MRTAHRSHRSIPPRSAFAGFRFPVDVIVLAVCWYLRFGLSYRDVEELLAELGVEVDYVTVYRGSVALRPTQGMPKTQPRLASDGHGQLVERNRHTCRVPWSGGN